MSYLLFPRQSDGVLDGNMANCTSTVPAVVGLQEVTDSCIDPTDSGSTASDAYQCVARLFTRRITGVEEMLAEGRREVEFLCRSSQN